MAHVIFDIQIDPWMAKRTFSAIARDSVLFNFDDLYGLGHDVCPMGRLNVLSAAWAPVRQELGRQGLGHHGASRHAPGLIDQRQCRCYPAAHA